MQIGDLNPEKETIANRITQLKNKNSKKVEVTRIMVLHRLKNWADNDIIKQFICALKQTRRNSSLLAG